MNPNIIPVFTSHYSLGRSTLTLDKPEKLIDGKPVKIEKPEDIEINSPVSIFSITKAYNLKQFFLVEDNFSGFIEAYNNAKSNSVQLTFGLKLVICKDILDKSEESFKTESKLIIWMKNSEGYKDLIRIYSKAATDGFYYCPRLDWKLLQSMMTDNLSVSIPAYSSFLHNNLLKRHECIPDFGKIKPNIFYSLHDLPFDSIIKTSHENYAKNNGLELIQCHNIRFYGKAQFDSYCTFRCINKRSVLSKPNLDGHGSRGFSWESYSNK